MKAGRFREDLFVPRPRLPRTTAEQLQDYEWPGKRTGADLKRAAREAVESELREAGGRIYVQGGRH